ncbi:MAG: UvrD-helicase domain-containing protein, partial [Candidatus Hodarchaeales archaeon]
MPLTGPQIRIIENADKSLSITAGAGTGKTFTLVETYLKLLEQPVNYRFSEILAITFTEKAAAEMRTRIRDEIAIKKPVLMEDFFDARISTFHAFALDILSSDPVSFQLPPGFRIADQTASKHLFDDIFDSMVSTPSGAAGEWVKPFISLLRTYGRFNLKKMLILLYNKRYLAKTFFKELERSPAKFIEKNRQIGEDLVGEFLARLGPLVDGDIGILNNLCKKYELDGNSGDKGIRYLATISGSVTDYLTSADTDARIKALLTLERVKPGKIAKRGLLEETDAVLLNVVKKRLQSNLSDEKNIANYLTNNDKFLTELLRIMKELSTVFNYLVEQTDRVKREAGLLDFDDLIDILLAQLEKNPVLVRDKLSKKIKHVLIDEYQDTDPRLFKIIKHILNNFVDTDIKLLIVGDPKQSIYLFRNAEVELFKTTQEVIIKKLSGLAEELSTNFRSTFDIVAFSNLVFGKLFHSDEKPWEFKYNPVVPARSEERGTIELILLDIDDNRFWEDGETIARKIKEICSSKTIHEKPADEHAEKIIRKVDYRDIAILLRRKRPLPEIEWALRKHGIPYHVFGGLGFYKRTEIKAVANILSFLGNREDDVALYGSLRSPFFGFSDALLFNINREEGHSLWKKLQDHAKNQEEDLAVKTVSKLQSWLKVARREPVPELIQRIIRQSGVYAVFGGLKDGDRIKANIEKLVNIARNQTRASAMTVSEFASYLNRLVDDDEIIEEEAQLEEEKSNSVKILTVHVSKGLEFPVVIVPDLKRRIRFESDKIVIDGEGIGLEVPDPENKYEFRKSRLLLAQQNLLTEKTRAEEMRLLYVALTRARDH